MAETALTLDIKNYKNNSVQGSKPGYVGYSTSGTFRTLITFSSPVKLKSITVTVNLESKSPQMSDAGLYYTVNATGERPDRGNGTLWYTMPKSSDYAAPKPVSFTAEQSFEANVTYYIWLVGDARNLAAYIKHESAITATGVEDSGIARLCVNGEYVRAAARIWTGNDWVQCQPYVYTNGGWRAQ